MGFLKDKTDHQNEKWAIAFLVKIRHSFLLCSFSRDISKSVLKFKCFYVQEKSSLQLW